ncbi:MAG: alpha-(1-_3)-arabinofuranosyltransferase family protein [Acidimicrobiales bacterium]|nr:alpha-(1->3)-arabinofuranosyltransferase family protein [Acidimicrobiales bacterium]
MTIRGLVDRVRRHAVLLTAAFVAYVPIVLSRPGTVGADTKTYLYLDPGRVLANASSLWDSDVALGTVTHQNIGYLWPMGPWYWFFETIGSPDWLAQRLWLGTLLFAAGAGVRYLLKTLDWQGPGLLIAVLAYEISPYVLDYSARISAVLLPWAGLPWMIALTIRAARNGGWRDPARFALVVLTVGSVNATSLLLVGLAPVAWLVHARLVERTVSTRAAVGAALRIGVLSLGVSIWWIAGLVLQGGYSLPVTRYTETYQTVASASTAPEVFRGLGYWFFYGNDKFGPWIQPSIEYTQGVWLLFLSFGLVVLSLLGAALVRWRHRSYFVLLIVMGGLIAVGSHPFDAPSPLGALFKDFTGTDAGLALRSTPRALPMLVLATSVLLAVVVRALHERWPGFARGFAALVVLAVVLNNPAIWRVRMIEEHLHRDEDVPEYWLEAIDHLDASGRDGRVMELPGSDFASYRWGNTVDPITPGFLDRGYVARELVPFGSAPSADLLIAFDQRFQEDTVDADAIAPIARLLSIDDIVHRADLTFERFRTPRPVPTAALLDEVDGLGDGIGFGPPAPNIAGPEQTMIDEVHLAIDPALPDPAPVTAYPVDGALDIVRTRPVTGGIVVVGDAEGLVDTAAAGLLDVERPLWFAADLVADPTLADTVLAEPATIVITDSNRREANRWGTLRENQGYTEWPGQEPLVDDPTDNRLELFAGVADAGLDPDDTRTVSVQEAPFRLRASDYGNPVTYTNDDRPVLAIDGDATTAWVVGAFAEARGEWLEFAYTTPTVVPSIRVVQPGGDVNRRITEIEIRADGELLRRVALTDASHTSPGQTIDLPTHEAASTFTVHLTDLDVAPQANYAGVSPVGFAEIVMAGAEPVTEFLRTPVALVEQLGDDLAEHDLAVVVTRERSNPQEPVREDPEREIRRIVVTAHDREFVLGGSARVSAAVDDSVVDALLGRTTDTLGDAMWARAEESLQGDLRSIASMAFDGDPTTAWTGEFGGQLWRWVEVEHDAPVSFDGIEVLVVNDALHSVPTEIEVSVDGTVIGAYPTGLRAGDAERGTVTRVSLPAVGTGRVVRLQSTAVDENTTRDWYSNDFIGLPTSFAEVDLGVGRAFGPLQPIATPCLPLATLDGVTAHARIEASVDEALDRDELTLVGCEPVSADSRIEIETSGRPHGFDIDQLVLSSPRPVEPPVAGPVVAVESHDDTSYRVRVPASEEDRWLVLGQSHNLGWEATVDGASLGEPVLIDGFANGWLLPAGDAVTVDLEWTPQRLVGRAMAVSIVALVIVLALALRRRRTMPAARATAPPPAVLALPWLDPPGPRGPVTVAVATAAGTGAAVFAWLNLPRLPGLAVLVGVAVAALLAWGNRRVRPALFAAGTLGVTVVALMLEQRAERYGPDFGWPQQFAHLHVWGVLAFLFLAADYLVAAVRRDDD